MPGSRSAIDRNTFLRAAAGLAALPLPAAGASNSATGTPPVQRRALVLSGGTAYGAYEAGVIAGLAASGAIDDYDVICGTSIGALNGAMIATNQAGAVRALWSSIATSNVLGPKREFRALFNPAAGVINRLAQAVHLILGSLDGNVRGYVDPAAANAVIRRIVYEADGKTVRAFTRPLLWCTTDLQLGCSRAFMREASQRDTEQIRARRGASPTLDDVQIPNVPRGEGIRLAGDAELPEALRSSTALPGVFDPIDLPGISATCVDGGVLNNSPFNLARYTRATEIDAVMLGWPVRGSADLNNSAQVLLECFNLMRQRILNDSILLSLLESDPQVRGLLSSGSAAGQALRSRLPPAINDFVNPAYGYPALTIRVLYPSAPFTGSSTDFTDQRAIDANIDLGYKDITTIGFAPIGAPVEHCPGSGP